VKKALLCGLVLIAFSSCSVIFLGVAKADISLDVYIEYESDGSYFARAYLDHYDEGAGEWKYIKNATVTVNGVELEMYESDTSDFTYYRDLVSLQPGDTVTVNVSHLFLGSVSATAEVPTGVPTYTIDNALPAVGIPLDDLNAFDQYTITLDDMIPPGLECAYWLYAYDGVNEGWWWSTLYYGTDASHTFDRPNDFDGNYLPYGEFFAQYQTQVEFSGFDEYSDVTIRGERGEFITNATSTWSVNQSVLGSLSPDPRPSERIRAH
jgi:hypothetical protein